MITYCVYEHTNIVDGKKYIGMCKDGKQKKGGIMGEDIPSKNSFGTQ